MTNIGRQPNSALVRQPEVAQFVDGHGWTLGQAQPTVFLNEATAGDRFNQEASARHGDLHRTSGNAH